MTQGLCKDVGGCGDHCGDMTPLPAHAGALQGFLQGEKGAEPTSLLQLHLSKFLREGNEFKLWLCKSCGVTRAGAVLR